MLALAKATGAVRSSIKGRNQMQARLDALPCFSEYRKIGNAPRQSEARTIHFGIPSFACSTLQMKVCRHRLCRVSCSNPTLPISKPEKMTPGMENKSPRKTNANNFETRIAPYVATKCKSSVQHPDSKWQAEWLCLLQKNIHIVLCHDKCVSAALVPPGIGIGGQVDPGWQRRWNELVQVKLSCVNAPREYRYHTTCQATRKM